MKQSVLIIAGIMAFGVSGTVFAAELAECRALADYQKPPGVDYEPGVDVEGNRVAPADLNAAPFELPDIMSVPLSVDLAQCLPDPPGGILGEAPLGFLEVHKNGRVTYEGQDWTPQIYAICRLTPPAPPPADPDDGQSPGNAVELPAPKDDKDRYN